jgi:RNAse (barnase) inhibitor barstar
LDNPTPFRIPTAIERAVLYRLALKWSARDPQWIETVLVRPLSDGSMGSLQIAGDGSRDHRFRSAVSEFSFADRDGVSVIVTLYCDDREEPFEVDVWKADFSAVEAFPLTAEYVGLLPLDTPEALEDGAAELRAKFPAAVVRILEGTAMRSFAGLYREFGEQLTLPAYFGANFNALRDCLTDLAWLPAERYLFLIRDLSAVLADERPEDFSAFVRLLDDVAGSWARPVAEGRAWDRPSVSCQFVLHTLRAEIAEQRSRLIASRVAWSEFSLEDLSR